MPSAKSTSSVPGAPAPEDCRPDTAHDPRDLAAGALGDDRAREVVFWRARAEELAAQLARLERRLTALGARLPARWAQLLASEPGELPEIAYWPDPLSGWNESTELEPAHVASVLPRLWDRLDPDAPR